MRIAAVAAPFSFRRRAVPPRLRDMKILLLALCSMLMLPVCGLMLSIFVGWMLPRHLYEAELGRTAWRLHALRLLLRWIVPAVIAAYAAAAQVSTL